MRRTARALAVAALTGVVVGTAAAGSAAPAPGRPDGTVAASLPCPAATGGAAPDAAVTPDILTGTRITAGGLGEDRPAADGECAGGTATRGRAPGTTAPGVPREGAGRLDDTGTATGGNGFTGGNGITGGDGSGLPDPGLAEPAPAETGIPDPARSGAHDTGAPYTDPYDTGAPDPGRHDTGTPHGTTRAPGTGRYEDGTKESGAQDGGAQEDGAHACGSTKQCGDGRTCDDARADTACEPSDGPRGANAGAGGAFNESVPALVTGGVLIAGAFGAAVHRLWRRKPGTDG
ncbi:hypothetical protein [Streptomyces sp. NPDC006012]|uniref:hypothetical protein n=1 Tax=Streptomyces sp. NPDC006012 TaxID=3364739 RepID=UPI00369AC491